MSTDDLYLPKDASIAMLLDYMALHSDEECRAITNTWVDELLNKLKNNVDGSVEFHRFENKGVFPFIYKDVVFFVTIKKSNRGKRFELIRINTVAGLTAHFGLSKQKTPDSV